jgi:copper resistance protein B
VTGSYDLLLTQISIAQPQAELNFYSKDDPAPQIGSGLSDLDAGVRLRYAISRKFAPYIGFACNGKYGNTEPDIRVTPEKSPGGLGF